MSAAAMNVSSAPKNASIGHYNSGVIDATIILFMILAGTNFGLYFHLIRGNWKILFRDSEWRFYLGIIGGLIFAGMAIKSQRATAAGSVWLGVMLCLYSLHDFRTDLWLYPELTDAGILANHWGHRLLAYPIALSWVLVSVWMMYRSMRALVGREGA